MRCVNKGRKKTVYSSFLLAVYGYDGKLYPVTKVGTGFQDSFLLEMTSYIDKNRVSESSNILLNGLKPDVLIAPGIVWEIGFDSFTISPIYQVGKGIAARDRGISLRFPKFLRVRDDKNIDQANTTEDIIELYNKSIDFN